MSRDSSVQVTKLSRMLRRNMTKEERRLWYDFLKKLPMHVNRQKPLGDCIVDFYIAAVKIVIELDGSQHYTEEGRAKDAERDEFLSSTGNMILRYSNYDLNTNFDGVCLDIRRNIEARLGIDDIYGGDRP